MTCSIVTIVSSNLRSQLRTRIRLISSYILSIPSLPYRRDPLILLLYQDLPWITPRGAVHNTRVPASKAVVWAYGEAGCWPGGSVVIPEDVGILDISEIRSSERRNLDLDFCFGFNLLVDGKLSWECVFLFFRRNFWMSNRILCPALPCFDRSCPAVPTAWLTIVFYVV
jgi:hypothetical protein